MNIRFVFYFVLFIYLLIYFILLFSIIFWGTFENLCWICAMQILIKKTPLNYNQPQAAQDKHFSERTESNKVNLTSLLLLYHI